MKAFALCRNRTNEVIGYHFCDDGVRFNADDLRGVVDPDDVDQVTAYEVDPSTISSARAYRVEKSSMVEVAADEVESHGGATSHYPDDEPDRTVVVHEVS